jgi:hypothetical protein
MEPSRLKEKIELLGNSRHRVEGKEDGDRVRVSRVAPLRGAPVGRAIHGFGVWTRPPLLLFFGFDC